MVFLLSKATNAALSRAQHWQNGRQTILDHECQVTGNVGNGKRHDHHDQEKRLGRSCDLPRRTDWL
jgi:hypothetical protein